MVLKPVRGAKGKAWSLRGSVKYFLFLGGSSFVFKEKEHSEWEEAQPWGV